MPSEARMEHDSPMSALFHGSTVVGRPENSCVVTLMKRRTSGQSDALWERGCVTLDTEIHMIKGRLEIAF
jgi:hypothetical protein